MGWYTRSMNQDLEAPVCYTARNGSVIAIHVPNLRTANGVSFHTEVSDPMQVATMRHPKGHVIRPHVHPPQNRVLESTSEVLVIRSGRMRVHLFENEVTPLATFVASSGDSVILFGGGHGFEVLQDIDFVEVKQGPYCPSLDKKHFDWPK